MNHSLKLLLLFFTLVFSIGVQAQDQYCDLTKQWVEFEPKLPEGNKFLRFSEIYKGELYVLTAKDVNRYVWNIYKLDTVDGWEFITDIETNCIVYGFTLYKDEIYVAGPCSNTGGPGFGRVVRYDGTRWNPTRLDSAAAGVGTLTDMQVYKGELYVTGTIGAPFNGIAKYDGVKWSTLKEGLEPSVPQSNYSLGRALEVLNDTLYVGGDFKMTKHANNLNFAAWDGSAWHNVPSTDRRIFAMHATSSRLVAYAPGASIFGGQRIQTLAFFKNGKWHSMGLIDGDWIGAAEITNIDDEIYMHTLGSTLQGKHMGKGVVRYRNNKWERTSQFSQHGNNELTSYKGRIIVSHPGSSCGNTIKSLGVLCEVNTCSSVSGQVFVDKNDNCKMDDEVGVPYPKVMIAGEGYAVGDEKGNWRAFLPVGDYNLSYRPPKYYDSDCSSKTVGITVGSSSVAFGHAGDVDFAVSSIGPYNDLQVSITGGRARVGFDAWIQVSVKNVGTTTVSGNLVTTLDDIQIYKSNNAGMKVFGRELDWDFGSLESFESKKATIYYKVPADIDLMGEKLVIPTFGSIVRTDHDTTDNKDTAVIEITAAYDPNEKEVSPKGVDVKGVQGAVLRKETNEFVYTIHFQNTGNDTAFTVVLKDTFDQNLDLSTLEIIDASHTMKLLHNDGRAFNFRFDNILLPDSTTNLIGSQGFVKYKISTVKGRPLNTKIKNRASIYFDYNPPIHTNEVVNTLVDKIEVSVDEVELSNYLFFPNPTTGWLRIKSQSEQQLDQGSVRIEITDMFGRVVLTRDLKDHETKINLNELTSGVYLVQLHAPKRRYEAVKITLLNGR